MLLGEYEHTIDDKNRLTLPARFRQSFAEGVVVSRGIDACLDVYTREPYVPEEESRDLRSLGNVILTPHIGSATVEANRRMAERALQNIRFAHAGQIDRMDLINTRD